MFAIFSPAIPQIVNYEFNRESWGVWYKVETKGAWGPKDMKLPVLELKGIWSDFSGGVCAPPKSMRNVVIPDKFQAYGDIMGLSESKTMGLDIRFPINGEYKMLYPIWLAAKNPVKGDKNYDCAAFLEQPFGSGGSKLQIKFEKDFMLTVYYFIFPKGEKSEQKIAHLPTEGPLSKYGYLLSAAFPNWKDSYAVKVKYFTLSDETGILEKETQFDVKEFEVCKDGVKCFKTFLRLHGSQNERVSKIEISMSDTSTGAEFTFDVPVDAAAWGSEVMLPDTGELLQNGMPPFPAVPASK